MSIAATSMNFGRRSGTALLTMLQMLPSRIESVLAMAVVGVIFLLVLPIPPVVMDTLIACNLFLSALLISLSLYVTGITAFSTFPVVLLLSTLFRLGISVATTRLILLDGHAGSIVDTFGNFVVRGDVIVGLVIFLIVTIVQFLVVTKGAERVAEVSARFCLDAMPAKQLAIENELRANLIDQAEAKRQRGQLNTETQLLGAMDGAMKFVKGDAIAGMVIVVVNLLGGLASGMFAKGMSAKEAIAHYSVQTVGDGLVAQIPALLTCLTAAILITRVDSASRAKDAPVRTFGGDLLGQLGAYPRAFWGLSAVMLMFALIPGMPTVVFICLAALAAGLAYMAQRRTKAETAAQGLAEKTPTHQQADAAIVQEFTQMEPLQLVFPVSAQGLPQVEELCASAGRARNELVTSVGMSLPGFSFHYDPAMPSDAFEMRIYEVPVTRLPMRIDEIAFSGRQAQAAAELASAYVEEGVGVAGLDVVWVRSDGLDGNEDLRQYALSWASCCRERVKRKLMRYGPRFTGVQTAQKYMAWMEGWMPELAKELQKSLSTSKLADVAQRLLREGVSIRNMRLIMETLSDVGQREREPAVLTEFVRYALREQICHELAPGGRLDVFVLAPELEELLTQSIRQGAGGSFLGLSPQESSHVIDAVRQTLSTHQDRNAPVLVCAQDVRRFVRTMLEPDLPDVVVMSVGELNPEIAVSVLDTVELPQDLP